MDWDRDGFAPGFLVGGWDTAPFDPARPAPILDRSFGARPTAADGPPPDAAAPAQNAAAPHMLLLTLDACRADVVAPAPAAKSPLGALRPPTPVLDSLAARSAVFDAAYTPSAGTEDTFGSLFAGDYLPGILLGTDPGRYLAARLERRGYAVRAWADESFFVRSLWGFARLDACPRSEARRMLEDAAAFLGALPPGQPGFAWIHVMDLHSEVLKPLSLDAYSRSRKLAAYARALGHVDSLVGTLTGALRREGIAELTLIAVSADHGEEFGEHGHFNHN